MTFDFTSVIDRKGHDSIAAEIIPYDNPVVDENFDIIPMWVADMAFATAPAVTDAIKKRLEHPTFGYFNPSNDYTSSIIDWQKRRNGADISRDEICYDNSVLGGVMSALGAVYGNGKTGKVLVHSPTYVGFTGALTNAGYEIVHSALQPDSNGIMRMDYADMDNKLSGGDIKAAILCSPHNPCGRVWERCELEKAMELYKKYDVTVISDEIWSDLILEGHKHIPTHLISADAKDRTVSLYAITKSFSLAGLVGSYRIIKNEDLRKKVDKQASFSHYDQMNVLSMHALIGAYSPEGEAWLEELRQVLTENASFAVKYIEENFDGVRFSTPQGTYMMFLDCTEWCEKHNVSIDELQRRGIKVGVVWQDGRPFHGPCHIRINLALPKSRLIEAFERLKKYAFIFS